MKITVEAILNANRSLEAQRRALSSSLKNDPVFNRYPLALQRRIERALLIGSSPRACRDARRRDARRRDARRDALRHSALALSPAKMVRSAGRPPIDDSAAVAIGVRLFMSGEVRSRAAAAREVCPDSPEAPYYKAYIKRVSKKIAAVVNN